MKTTGQTIFITGGSAGIGLALAQALIARQNTVIICGRDREALAQLKLQNPAMHVIGCDVTKTDEVEHALEEIQRNFGRLDILINNAGIQYNYNFLEESDALQKADEEIDINFRAVVRLTKFCLPLLMKQPASAIINISSPLALVPKESAPLYSATKAAVKVFSQVLRYQLESTTVRVFTVYPPLVATAMTEGRGEKIKISPEEFASAMLEGLERDQYEMPIKKAKLLFLLYRLWPSLAHKLMRKGI